MSDTIFRMKMWRFGVFEIEEFEVVKRTAKTVVIRIPDEHEGSYESRYHLKSDDYSFFDTQKQADFAAENVVFTRMAYYRQQADDLLERLKEVCEHKSIDAKGKCNRCEFRVPNPEDYCDGG